MKLILPIEIHCATMPKSTLFSTYHPEEVLGYCSQCNSYGANYSCPDYDFNPISYLAPYSYATLILTEVSSAPVMRQWDLLKGQHFDSMVGRLHLKEEEADSYDAAAAFSMLAFNLVKDELAEILLEAESQWSETLSSPPGSCTRCQECYKKKGEPCIYPKQLRYSLEALGFLVSDIYSQFFDITLEWSQGTLPEHFQSCSVLYSKSPIDETALVSYIKDRYSELNIEL